MQEEVEFNPETATTSEILRWAALTYPGIVFATSFGAEDMVLLDMIHAANLPVQIITLDTGRLPPETYSLMERVSLRYKLPIITFFPNTQQVEDMVNRKGHFSFRESIENRKECCKVRKIDQLRRALQGKKAWITGLRASQSVTRNDMKIVEDDAFFGNIKKINPLKNWTEQEVWDYIKKNNVPYNKLHDKGYPSIGCGPCTRPIQAGEDVRAGRWWWENPDQKECGLHRYTD